LDAEPAEALQGAGKPALAPDPETEAVVSPEPTPPEYAEPVAVVDPVPLEVSTTDIQDASEAGEQASLRLNFGGDSDGAADPLAFASDASSDDIYADDIYADDVGDTPSRIQSIVVEEYTSDIVEAESDLLAELEAATGDMDYEPMPPDTQGALEAVDTLIGEPLYPTNKAEPPVYRAEPTAPPDPESELEPEPDAESESQPWPEFKPDPKPEPWPEPVFDPAAAFPEDAAVPGPPEPLYDPDKQTISGVPAPEPPTPDMPTDMGQPAPSEEPLFLFTESEASLQEDTDEDLAMAEGDDEGPDAVLDMEAPGSTVVLPREGVQVVPVRPPTGPHPNGTGQLMLVDDASDVSASADQRPVAPPPPRRAPALNDPVYALMLETMDRIRNVYGASPPPDSVHRIQALVDSQDYERIREQFGILMDELVEHHRQAGTQLQPRVAHNFRIIDTLVRNL
jgi:hypothetical protein